LRSREDWARGESVGDLRADMGLLFHIYPIQILVQNARAAWSDLGFFALDCYPKSKALRTFYQHAVCPVRVHHSTIDCKGADGARRGGSIVA
jgi:hypothetical protein